MEKLLPLLLIGFFVYLVFFRKGGMGMGCCGGHGHHNPEHQKPDPEKKGSSVKSEIVDLPEEEYQVSKK